MSVMSHGSQELGCLLMLCSTVNLQHANHIIAARSVLLRTYFSTFRVGGASQPGQYVNETTMLHVSLQPCWPNTKLSTNVM